MAESTNSHSSLGMASISFNTNTVLPDQWTLPGQINIEKRETFENWKIDVQCQMAAMEKQLSYLTTVTPDPEDGIYTARLSNADEQRLDMVRQYMRGKMQTGVKR